LRRRQPLSRKRLGPGLGKTDLADRRRRLLLLQPELRLGEAQCAPGKGDGARGDDDDLDARPPQRGDIGGHLVEPALPGARGLGVDHQRAAELDDQPAGGGDGGQGDRRLRLDGAHALAAVL
jgi:hypothetical protein